MDKLIKQLETVCDNDVTIYKSLVKLEDGTNIDIVNSRIIQSHKIRNATRAEVVAACKIYLRKRSKKAGLHDYCVKVVASRDKRKKSKICM